MSTLQDFRIGSIDGATANLVPELSGKVVLAVNVASKCGLTPQYAGLERLYEEMHDQGFVIVGFPCNQFGGQGKPTITKPWSCMSSYSRSSPAYCGVSPHLLATFTASTTLPLSSGTRLAMARRMIRS